MDQISSLRQKEIRTLKIMDTCPPQLNAHSNVDSPLHTPTIRMPHLQHLELSHVLSSVSGDIGYYRRVKLPCLRVLDLTEEPQSIALFTKHVDIPRNTKISVTFSDIDPDDHDHIAQAVCSLASRFTPDPDSKDSICPLQSLVCNISEAILVAWTITRGSIKVKAIGEFRRHSRVLASNRLSEFSGFGKW